MIKKLVIAMVFGLSALSLSEKILTCKESDDIILEMSETAYIKGAVLSNNLSPEEKMDILVLMVNLQWHIIDSHYTNYKDAKERVGLIDSYSDEYRKIKKGEKNDYFPGKFNELKKTKNRKIFQKNKEF